MCMSRVCILCEVFCSGSSAIRALWSALHICALSYFRACLYRETRIHRSTLFCISYPSYETRIQFCGPLVPQPAWSSRTVHRDVFRVWVFRILCVGPRAAVSAGWASWHACSGVRGGELPVLRCAEVFNMQKRCFSGTPTRKFFEPICRTNIQFLGVFRRWIKHRTDVPECWAFVCPNPSRRVSGLPGILVFLGVRHQESRKSHY